MAFDAHENFAVSTVATAPSPATTGTSLVVATGGGALFPAAPFNVTIWPASSQPTSANAEIARVTAVSTDTLTITRAQESSSARTVVVGDQIAATVTTKTFTDIEAVIGSSAPGSLIGYAEITSPVNITDTLETTATAIISPGALTFDGGEVMVEVFAPFVKLPTAAGANSVLVTLFEGATQICRLIDRAINNNVAGFAITMEAFGSMKFTPSAGSHTYKVCAFVSTTTGTPVFGAGAGGTGAYAPSFIRFTKV